MLSPKFQLYDATVPSGSDDVKPSNEPTRPLDEETNAATGGWFGAVTDTVCVPADSVELVMLQLPELSATPLPSTVVPLVSCSVTVAPASAPLPMKVGVVTLVMLSVDDLPESDAA